MAQFEARPIVAVTMGDAAGIGPEIVVKSLASEHVHAVCRPLVIGDARVMHDALRFSPRPLKLRSIARAEEAAYRFDEMDVLDLANIAPREYDSGAVSVACGRAFVETIRVSAGMANQGVVDAVASGPTNKESMHEAGFTQYSGQTDIYAEMCGSRSYFTVLVGGKSRVYLLTSHVSLRKALDSVTRARVESIIRIADQSLRELWKIKRPHIGVAGLNPHAGDGGLFGDEELNAIIPAVESARASGIHVAGPESADSLYLAADQGEYDGIIGMYHDQGVIPLKRHGYVTVIAGTSILRTTAGHGTAYDIAWQGVARADVMERAIVLAAELAKLRRRSQAKAGAPKVTS
jgi:4-hydroxythreonine-4-phosphate dehydrogenase